MNNICIPKTINDQTILVNPETMLFLNSRMINLSGEIDDELAQNIKNQLLCLDSLKNDDITLIIDSLGGSIKSGLIIVDTMKTIKSKVNTIVNGTAASMASIVLAVGEKRIAHEHSRIMIHQPLASFQGKFDDINTQYSELIKTKNEIYELLAKASNKDIGTIENDCKTNYWMTAIEAKEYGLIDEILSNSKE